MFKNLTIRQITLYITALIALGNAVLLLFLLWQPNAYFPIGRFALLLFLSTVFSYLCVRFLLERFVFRKIKLIYKIIHDSKLTPGETTPSLNLDDAILESVNDEVVEWAEKTREEITYLKTLETYRKNFVGNISHELKTPIFSIQGYLHTLLDGGLHDQQINEKYLERAASNVERLQTIVEDLEVINRLESGAMVLDLRKFDLRQLAEEVVTDLEIQARERDIDISFKDGANQAFSVQADRENIRQVLINLITNSIKYGKEGGETKISFYDMDERVLVEISDNGIGIEENHLKHVFDRFYRVDTSRSRSMGGSGLGLAIVKHIIEAHQETINVRSTIDVGSTFGFTLLKSSS